MADLELLSRGNSFLGSSYTKTHGFINFSGLVSTFSLLAASLLATGPRARNTTSSTGSGSSSHGNVAYLPCLELPCLADYNTPSGMRWAWDGTYARNGGNFSCEHDFFRCVGVYHVYVLNVLFCTCVPYALCAASTHFPRFPSPSPSPPPSPSSGATGSSWP